MITCSDASETGGGLCASGGLTEMGLEMLGQLQSPAYRVDRVLPFSPHGAISRRKMKGPRLVYSITFRWHLCPHVRVVSVGMSGCSIRVI